MIDVESHRRQTGRQRAARRAGSTQDADAHEATPPAGTRYAPTRTAAVTSPLPPDRSSHGTSRRQAHPRHRRAHRRLAGVRRGRAGAAGGGRDRAHRCGPGPEPHPTHRPASCPPSPTCSSSTSPTPPTPRRCGTRWPRSGAASTARCTPSGSRPASCLGGGFLTAGWDDVSVALHISAYSLKTLADAVVPLMTEGGSHRRPRLRCRGGLARLRLDGRGKAALESTSRYLARDLGPQGDPREPGRRRARHAPWRRSRSRASSLRGRRGTSGRPLGGTSPTRHPSPRRASPCCRTGSR